MKNLIKSSSLLMLGELVTKFLSVLYLIPLIRINKDIGVLNAIVTIPFGLFVIFGTLGLNILLTSYIAKYRFEENKLTSCVFSTLIILIITSLLSSIFLFCFAEEITVKMISDLKYINELIIATKILSIGVLLYAITSYQRAIISAYELFDKISFSYVFEQVVKVILIIIPTIMLIEHQRHNVGDYAIILSLAIIISMFLTFIYYTYIMYKYDIFNKIIKGKFNFDPILARNILIGSIVILAASLYASCYEMIDITMLENYFKSIHLNIERSNLIKGIYFTNSWKIIFIPISIAGGIITVMMTKVSNNTKNNMQEFDLILTISLFFGIISMLMIFLCGENVYNILYGSHSQQIIMMQSLLIPLYIVRNIIGTYVVSNNGSNKSVIYSLIIMVILKMFLNLIFINIFEVFGLIVSSILSIIISIIILIYFNQDLFKFNPKFKQFRVEIIIKSLILLFIFNLINIFIKDMSLLIFILKLILGGILILGMYYKDIIMMLKGE